ncbi:BglG family transcription antiterminator LicT [Clostridium magnum]|uniref:Transcription antiterminator LicT n=1 Tax=Clostridium magnum DSM 2767 TaxID=1121326 RepID=A0A168DWX1_9CLOT|nr:PRD domain-containing protein [Clostridium magnum]KZL91564.1 transcription antiterminator LicT [Clostridium magnum DSM 2767]SHH47788.1 transcriptional antiterminator, BglG family [Clostridium magnum DSM 2767]
MKIEKILNNNVVTTIDEETGLEKVIMGRGIAFKKKIGEEIDEAQIQKVFLIQNKNENLKFQRLINEIPLEYVQVSEKIISYAKQMLDVEFDDHIYVALTDHLAFAIKRALAGIRIENNLLWEIQRIHKKEYEVGLWAIEFIEKELGVKLKEDEAGFIALHLINGSIGEIMPNTMNITTIIQDVLNIIKYYFIIEFDEDDLSYDRLITHLKYFAQRIISQKQLTEDEAPFLKLIKEDYKDVYKCALKIKTYIQDNYDYTIRDGEIVYLSLHLQRVMSSLKK